jgi:Domain of unknown function (DUF932)
MTTLNNTQEFLSSNGLNWNTELVQEIHPLHGTKINSYATMRSDNQEILKTGLSKGYRPIHNEQIAKMALTLSREFDIKTEKVELIGNGKKIIVQVTSGLAEIGDTLKGGKPDHIALRTTFLHDNTGGGALKFTPSPFRLICKNQLAVISKLSSQYIKDVITKSIYHNSKGQLGIQNILDAGKIIFNQNLGTIATFQDLARTKINNYDIKEILDSMVKKMDYDLQVQQEIERLIFEADSGLTDPNSLWGVYNGVTRFHDHFSGRKNPSTNNLVFGSIAKKNTLALDHILQYMQA